MSKHTENMPILYINIMDGLPSDFARSAFLWATDRSGNDRMCYAAERFAREADTLVSVLKPLLSKGAEILAKQKPSLLSDTARQEDDLMRFILTRHANYYYGSNLVASYI